MREGWELMKLGEVCELVRGPFGGSLKKSSFVSKGLAVYEQQHAIHNRFSTFRYFIDADKYAEMNRFKVHPGNILMSCSGTIGRVAKVPRDAPQGIINQALLNIKPSSKVDNDYLLYALKSPYFFDQISNSSEGVAIKNVASVKVLKDIKIPLPPLEEQKRIVALLDEAFEGLETARANAEANLKSAEELFQSSLQRGIGEEAFKQGWELKELGDVVELSPKKRITKETLSSESLVSFAPMENLQSGSRSFMSAEDRPLASVYSSYTYFANGDVLLAKITPCFENGKLGVASGLTNGVGFGSSEFMVLRPSSSILPEYLYYYLDQEQFRVWAAKQMTGAVGHKRVPKELIANLKLPLPPLEEQKRIASKLDDMRANLSSVKEQYKSQSEDIIVLRQSLLQKAFAGELT